MTYHKNGFLVCHYCGKTKKQPNLCPKCGSKYVKFFGAGTERVEEEVRKYLKNAKILRMDVDTTRAKDSHEKIYNAFKAGEADILIGTQMVSKGLDFPNVTLVGILSADMSLNLPDYRAAERSFQIITQVAGRAGRGEKEGEVIVQTYTPEHYSLQYAKKYDYEDFDNNLKGIASKILSLAFDYPIIFMGYSLEDHNVQNILYTLIDCLSDAQLKEIAQNIIYVNWKPGESRLIQTKKTITSNGRSLTMTNIDTDNYYAIYKYLQQFTPTERPERVRKYKKMIRELIVKSNTGQRTIVAAQNLDKLNSDNNLVVAFCDKETLSYKGLIGFSVQDMINDVLSQTVYSSEKAKNIGVDVYNENSSFVKTNYIPIFYYLKTIDREFWENEQKIIAAYSNCQKMIDSLLADRKIDTMNFDTLMSKRESLAQYRLFSVAIKSYALGFIDYPQYIKFLNEMGKDKKNRSDTYFKKAITYADFKIIAEKVSH